jgi:hypothetical protein
MTAPGRGRRRMRDIMIAGKMRFVAVRRLGVRRDRRLGHHVGRNAGLIAGRRFEVMRVASAGVAVIVVITVLIADVTVLLFVFLFVFLPGFVPLFRRAVATGFLGGRRGAALHVIVSRARRTAGFGAGLAETLRLGHRVAEVAQALIAQRRAGFVRLRCFRPAAPGGLDFELADRFLERQALAGDVRLIERRIDATQLVHQCRARPLV